MELALMQSFETVVAVNSPIIHMNQQHFRYSSHLGIYMQTLDFFKFCMA